MQDNQLKDSTTSCPFNRYALTGTFEKLCSLLLLLDSDNSFEDSIGKGSYIFKAPSEAQI